MAVEKYDFEADVVVIGYGGAGANAAIIAHDAGADVLILEKMANGGGNTRVCGGAITTPSAKEFLDYLVTLNYGYTEQEIIERHVEEALKNPDWVRELGGNLVKKVYLRVSFPDMSKFSYPEVTGAQYGEKKTVEGAANVPLSLRVWNLLSSNVERRGIRVMTSTRANNLITNQDGEVIGVDAETQEKSITVKAKRAVIMTCGGYEYDEAIKRDFLPCKPVHAMGNPGNTGDGIRMVQRLGAALWHMSNMPCFTGIKVPEYEAAFPIQFISERTIFVDKLAKRFINEAEIEVHDFGKIFSVFDSERIDFVHIPFYGIFDEIARRKGPLNENIMGFNRELYKWSADNSAEIRKGWILRGKSVAELADKMSVDRTTLEETMKKYNDYCKAGRDDDFGRGREYLTPLDKPPYYAVELWPALFNTQGGPRRDKEARILDVDGKPIPRLYAAGEFGSIWAGLYSGGNNVAEGMTFGRIAGRNAAAEKPWA